ncbi:MAG: hypothetical protein JJT89_00505 [Nitriliruptoraceae bacterium]|nr:hypothetical protein [Nitriliruptoraceae bacterium]
MATRTKTQPVDPHVDARTARLYEVSGHYGPWTSREYNEAFPPRTPNTGPDPEPPAEVVELAEARDIAAAAFERIDEQWQAAALAERAAQDAGPVMVNKLGQMFTDPKGPRRLRKAREVLDELNSERDLAREVLHRASAKWRAAETAWRHQLLADELAASRK